MREIEYSDLAELFDSPPRRICHICFLRDIQRNCHSSGVKGFTRCARNHYHFVLQFTICHRLREPILQVPCRCNRRGSLRAYGIPW